MAGAVAALELAADVVEGGGDLGAERGGGADDDDGDQGRDQSVLDRGHGTVVAAKMRENMTDIGKHGWQTPG